MKLAIPSHPCADAGAHTREPAHTIGVKEIESYEREVST